MRPRLRIVHVVARCRPLRFPLGRADRARWLWERLRRAFPEALAVCLMPNHVHLLVVTADPDSARRRLARILGAFSRCFELGELWEPLPAPSVFDDPEKALLQLRYVHLNPCRPFRLAGGWHTITPDPLAWAWSTHRDLVGAIADPWVTPERVAGLFERPQARSLRALHEYVCSDTRVARGANQLPRSATPRDVPARSLEAIAVAAAAAARQPAGAVKRRGLARDLFVALALHQGWRDPGHIGEACGVQRRGIRLSAARGPEKGLAAAAMCLENSRLVGGEGWAPHRREWT